jgi:hypothetical protein
MSPEQPVQSPVPQPQPVQPQPINTDTQPPATDQTKVPLYRSYWPFAAIYLILPPIFGLIILLTGEVYRKQKDGQMQPISLREKITLTIVVLLLWGYVVFVK